MLASSPLNVVIEQVIEAGLRFDPDTRERLQTLDGKVICLQLSKPAMSLTLSVVDGRVYVTDASDQAPDTTISGSIAALRSLMGSNAALYRGDVSISGDLGTGQALKALLAGMDPDWEERLSRALALVMPAAVGDALVHRLAGAARGLDDWLTRSRSSFARDAHDYLQEEATLLPANGEVREFVDEVDALRADTDRLTARIRQLEAQQ